MPMYQGGVGSFQNTLGKKIKVISDQSILTAAQVLAGTKVVNLPQTITLSKVLMVTTCFYAVGESLIYSEVTSQIIGYAENCTLSTTTITFGLPAMGNENDFINYEVHLYE